MSKYRQAARIDNNQREIVKSLRKLGYSVVVGHDDILVGVNGKTYWFECKNPSLVSKKTGQVRPSEIKPSQRTLMREFKGHYSIVWNLEQILDEINASVS
jgi:Holliday junction resolvase